MFLSSFGLQNLFKQLVRLIRAKNKHLSPFRVPKALVDMKALNGK